MNTNRLRLALRWRDDVADDTGDWRHGYKRTHIFFVGDVSKEEFKAICDAGNTFYKAIGSPLRMRPEMGEILPYVEGEETHHAVLDQSRRVAKAEKQA